MNRAETAETLGALAPPHPPCFGSRALWLSWLIAAEDACGPNSPSAPLLVAKDGTVTFNRHLSFCEDCAEGYREEQQRLDACHPLVVLVYMQRFREPALA